MITLAFYRTEQRATSLDVWQAVGARCSEQKVANLGCVRVATPHPPQPLYGGRFGDVHILSPVTVRQMTQSQYPWGDSVERLAGASEEHFVTLSKRLGWMVRGQGFFRGSDLMSSRAFFHGGYLGMRVMVDTE